MWPSLPPRRSVWKGTLGRSDCTVSNGVKSNKHAFRRTLHWKFLRKAYGLRTNLVSWSMQKWRQLNWSITDELNWQTWKGRGYQNWRTDEIFYRQSMTWIAVKLLVCSRCRPTFLLQIWCSEIGWATQKWLFSGFYTVDEPPPWLVRLEQP